MRDTSFGREVISLYEGGATVSSLTKNAKLQYSTGLIQSKTYHDPAIRNAPHPLDAEQVQWLLQSIQEGVQTVLEPQGFGAIIQVSNLFIYLVDCLSIACRWHTIRYLEKALSSAEE